jgi:hypothetical protein
MITHNTTELINRHKKPLREAGNVVAAIPGVEMGVVTLELSGIEFT